MKQQPTPAKGHPAPASATSGRSWKREPCHWILWGLLWPPSGLLPERNQTGSLDCTPAAPCGPFVPQFQSLPLKRTRVSAMTQSTWLLVLSEYIPFTVGLSPSLGALGGLRLHSQHLAHSRHIENVPLLLKSVGTMLLTIPIGIPSCPSILHCGMATPRGSESGLWAPGSTGPGLVAPGSTCKFLHLHYIAFTLTTGRPHLKLGINAAEDGIRLWARDGAPSQACPGEFLVALMALREWPCCLQMTRNETCSEISLEEERARA